MSILITGMDMPTGGAVIAIYKLGGQFYASMNGTELCPLVYVPPHGDLIERNRIKWINGEFEERCHNDRWTVVEKIAYKDQVDKLPTIIQAEVGDD